MTKSCFIFYLCVIVTCVSCVEKQVRVARAEFSQSATEPQASAIKLWISNETSQGIFIATAFNSSTDLMSTETKPSCLANCQEKIHEDDGVPDLFPIEARSQKILEVHPAQGCVLIPGCNGKYTLNYRIFYTSDKNKIPRPGNLESLDSSKIKYGTTEEFSISIKRLR